MADDEQVSTDSVENTTAHSRAFDITQPLEQILLIANMKTCPSEPARQQELGQYNHDLYATMVPVVLLPGDEFSDGGNDGLIVNPSFVRTEPNPSTPDAQMLLMGYEGTSNGGFGLDIDLSPDQPFKPGAVALRGLVR